MMIITCLILAAGGRVIMAIDIDKELSLKSLSLLVVIFDG